MALPEQIRKQTEAVQEIYKQMNAGSESQEGQGAPTNETPPVPNVDAPPADENGAENAAPSPAVEQKAGDDKVSEETVLQKYKTLQGMYNAEVPRLHAQNREMQQRVQQMEQLLASMANQPQTTSAPQTPQAERLVTDKDVEEYGDSLEVMRKVTREELGSVASRIAQLEKMLSQFQTNVVPQVQAVAQRQAVSAEQQFWSTLTATVPNWREVNDNADFQTWLLEVDPLTNISRQTYLEDAQRGLDASRVANFFRTWLDKTGQATVAQPTGRASVTSELERQVAPGRAKNTGTQTSNKAKVYTPADIQQFFSDVRQGKYRGKEQERARIERDIFAAQRENRIQLNA
jgi:hypothetical protein